MEKVHLIVDLAKCVGCYNCFLACKDEHVGNKWLPYTDAQQKHDVKWINLDKCERGCAPYTEVCYVPKMCYHCENAPCEKACPDAVTRRPDGVVLLNVHKAKGNRALADACPYGMISWNDELQTAQKCTMCAHLLDTGWKEPRCVQACPLRALSFVSCEDAEFDTIVRQQVLKPLTDGANKPRVYYKNLYKSNTCFIGGGLAYSAGDIKKAAVGANVRLTLNGEVLKEETTDFLGEFKIDRLPKNAGTFKLLFTMDGYTPIEKEVTVGTKSQFLDVMFFEKTNLV